MNAVSRPRHFFEFFGKMISPEGEDFHQNPRFGYTFHSLNFAGLHILARSMLFFA